MLSYYFFLIVISDLIAFSIGITNEPRVHLHLVSGLSCLLRSAPTGSGEGVVSSGEPSHGTVMLGDP